MLKILLILVGVCFGVFLFKDALRENHQPAFLISSIQGENFPKKLITDGREFTVTKPPERIVSCTFAADEIILSLVDHSRIHAITFVCDDPDYSRLSSLAKKVPNRVSRVKDVERLLSMQPDLLIVDPWNSTDSVMLLSQTRIPILKISYPQSIYEIERNILLLGRVLGTEAKAAELVSLMSQSILQTRMNTAERKPRVLYVLGGSVSPTSGTLLDEVIRSSGGINSVSDRGQGRFIKTSLEELMSIDPDVIIVGGTMDLLNHPASRNLCAKKRGNIFTVKPYDTECSSHLIMNGVKEIAKNLQRVRLEDE